MSDLLHDTPSHSPRVVRQRLSVISPDIGYIQEPPHTAPCSFLSLNKPALHRPHTTVTLHCCLFIYNSKRPTHRPACSSQSSPASPSRPLQLLLSTWSKSDKESQCVPCCEVACTTKSVPRNRSTSSRNAPAPRPSQWQQCSGGC